MVFLAIFLSSCGLATLMPWNTEVPPPITPETPKTDENPLVMNLRSEDLENIDDGLAQTEKTERIAILWKQAEYLAINNEYRESAQLYERIFRLSWNNEVERKLAHISYKAKKYPRSTELYKKYKSELYLSEKEELLHALRYTADDGFLTLLGELNLPTHVKEANMVSWKCEHEYIACEEAIRGYQYDYAPIRDLKNALKNYESLWNKDISYKEALLISALYKNEDYTTAMKIGERVLQTKSDYRPILKIVGFSAFMIGQDERAAGVLAKYKKLEPKDPEVDFVLGVIHYERQDYDTSNIYFNKAILSGYVPKITVERKLAYNYYILDLPKNMFQVLGYLVLEPDSTEADFTNAIYLALTHNELRNADGWIKAGRKKFDKSDTLKALEAWHLRITGMKEEAQTIIDDILSQNPNHLIAVVQAGILAHESGEKIKAKTFFQRAKIMDTAGTWTKTIDEYLKK